MPTPVQLPPFFRGAQYDVRAESLPWHMLDQQLEKHWEQTGGGEGIISAVLDTGIDSDHQEFDHGAILESKSFVRGQGPHDGNGHGTHCAGTIVGKNVGGAPNAKLLSGKVLGDNGSGWNDDIQAGMLWAAEEGANIISMSLGSDQPDRRSEEIINDLRANGVIVIAASGNERASRVGYPSAYCIAIGAVNRQFQRARFSNQGVKLDAVGYGVDIYSSIPGGRYSEFSGTSMATPCVASYAANRLSAELKHLGKIVTKTDDDLLVLSSQTKDLGPPGRDPEYGFGFPWLDKLFYEGLQKPDEPTEPDQPPPTGSEPSGAEPIEVRLRGVESGREYLPNICMPKS